MVFQPFLEKKHINSQSSLLSKRVWRKPQNVLNSPFGHHFNVTSYQIFFPETAKLDGWLDFSLFTPFLPWWVWKVGKLSPKQVMGEKRGGQWGNRMKARPKNQPLKTQPNDWAVPAQQVQPRSAPEEGERVPATLSRANNTTSSLCNPGIFFVFCFLFFFLEERLTSLNNRRPTFLKN